MAQHIKITILVDDRLNQQNLTSEHGLSIWIETDNRRILFDAGQSEMLIHNAKILDINLSIANTLILSHGHYDHTGGVAKILEINPNIQVYCHPMIFKPRYSKQTDNSLKPIGIIKDISEALSKDTKNMHWVDKPYYIDKSIGLTGSIPRHSVYENTGGAFYTDHNAIIPDLVEDDMSMWIETEQGLIVISGCCHSGLINTLEYIHAITGNDKIYGLIGGFHLLHASKERMNATIEYLKSRQLQFIYPYHCTGEAASTAIRKELSLNTDCGVETANQGSTFVFKP